MRMKPSFIYLIILMLLGCANTVLAQNNGEIYGTVLDEKGLPFPGVIVKVTQGGIIKGGVVTEDDGKYSVKPLQPGNYDVEYSSFSYKTIRKTGVVVSSGGDTKVAIKMQEDAGDLKEFVIEKYSTPIADQHPVMGAKELERSGLRKIEDAASLVAGVQQVTSGGGLRIGGARSDGTGYILDGQFIQGQPTSAQGTIEQVQVFASGIPANLGDVSGGIVSVTSKGPTSTIKGSIQGQHSIDGYNQNLLNASVTGPLLTREKNGVKENIIGFLAGVDYQYDKDDAPTFYKNPVLKSDVLKGLQDNPLRVQNTQNGTQLVSAANTVTKNDFNYQKQQINNASTTVRFNGKLDYAVNKNINITLGGNMLYNTAQGSSRANSYFSPEIYPTNQNFTGRGYLRFKQSFANNTTTKDSGAADPVISNAFYTLQLDYQLSTSKSEDPNFKNNLFDYGYVGKFTQARQPIYAFGVDSLSGRQAVILQTLDAVTGLTFEASDKNPILTNYTRNAYDYANRFGGLGDFSGVQAIGGMMNGDMPVSALDVNNQRINNIGNSLRGYGYSTFNQVGLHADASFDFKPAKTTHAIQFGLYYEQRSSSNYNAQVNISNGGGTNSIWSLMRQLANRHIGGLDYSNPTYIHNGQSYTQSQIDSFGFFGPTDTVIYARKNTGNASVFDSSVRQKFGLGANDFIDVYSLDPSKLSLDMFSADELIQQGTQFVSYSGYSYTGAKIKGQTNFNDFFTQRDANGRLSRPIAAFTPNYISGYIMDKFRFQEMNFNVGVRIDRYDNNTKVLKDPYSLYEYNKKGQVDGARNLINDKKHPDNIGNDYAVYVNNNQSLTPSIIGYRSGDKWFSANGTELPDPAVLKDLNGGADPEPFLTRDGSIKIDSSAFNPNASFTDYTPQVNISPRFQFNFPINGDKARFYAHYDVLVQRPKVGNYASPLDYYFLASNTGSIIDNSNLKPEKTFDYELGYQTQVSSNSGIGISAFYKERKDMIQVRPYLYAFPRTYYTYGNRDFSSTKGFTFSYDYRKKDKATIPIEMTFSYTLQFADGTGSNATSSNGGNGNQVSGTGLLQNFISAGLPNLRYVMPLYNSRHTMNLNLNYSYGENEGPTVNNKHFLQNFNANLILRARSGEPYTTNQAVIGNAIQGGLNGNNLPWHLGSDFRIDKKFLINGSRTKMVDGNKVTVESKHKYYFAAFLYFQNIFNIKDVLGVYPYTTSPDDDGYVASATGQQFFSSSVAPQSQQDLYSLYVNNPGNYNAPRRAYVGFVFSF